MTPEQIGLLKRRMNIADGEEWERFAGLECRADELEATSPRCRSTQPVVRRHDAPRVAVPASFEVPRGERMSTQEGFGRLLATIARAASGACRPHRHDVARRDGVDQSGRVGEPPRPLRSRQRAERFRRSRASHRRRQWDDVADGPAHRARHRGKQSLHPAGRARALGAAVRHPAAADRDGVRPVHRARSRRAELRVLPGRPVHPRRHAIRV